MQCPICENYAPFYARHPEADLYQCGECRHRFSVLSAQNSGERYEPEYFEQTHRNWFMNPDVALFEQLSKVITADGVSRSVIDVGCGKGNFLAYLAVRVKQGLSLTGIDLSPNPPNSNIQYIAGDVMATSIPRQFDVVVSLSVIEHIADVQSFAGKLHDLCRLNGRVIVMTVNDDSILYRIARVARYLGFTLPFNRLYSCHHLHHFNRDSLLRLLERKGFAIEKVILHDAPLAAIDIPVSSPAIAMLLRLAVGTIFVAGRLVRRTYLQTVVCRRTGNKPVYPVAGNVEESMMTVPSSSNEHLQSR
jgi:2-polyprenyl-3-methyl-5-hydroxy-6-metoxy-1,4-benzoquinol methylase